MQVPELQHAEHLPCSLCSAPGLYALLVYSIQPGLMHQAWICHKHVHVDSKDMSDRLLLQITLGVNHFGLVYLTLHLLEVVKETAKKGPTARIVWVTSLGSQLVNPPIIGGTTKRPGIDYLDWEDLK